MPMSCCNDGGHMVRAARIHRKVVGQRRRGGLGVVHEVIVGCFFGRGRAAGARAILPHLLLRTSDMSPTPASPITLPADFQRLAARLEQVLKLRALPFAMRLCDSVEQPCTLLRHRHHRRRRHRPRGLPVGHCRAARSLRQPAALHAADGGAAHYLKTGAVLPDDTFAACRDAHAILHGAAGLPGVTYPDGTEVGNDLHLRCASGSTCTPTCGRSGCCAA
jgi:hypothetical protein